ncbi:MAG: FAD-binding oxidoreductase [Actinomycetota bacterium]
MDRGPRATLDPSAVASFREGFRGEIVLPEDHGYDSARIVWNAAVDRHPALVVRPTGADDVAAAVRFAREHDLVIAVRCGGHSVGGFSTCDDGMVIDLSVMRGVRVDPEARTARVAGGSLLGDLDREAQRFGLACPVGVVSHTGVGGLTLGGGMGRLQRKHGFSIDNMLSVDLLTADGRLIHVSEGENADLFWGIRGAGPNFGVVTSFEFRLYPIGPQMVQGWVAHPIDRARELGALFREFSRSAPDEVFCSFALAVAGADDPWPAGQPAVVLGGAHCGTADAAERDLRPLRDGEPTQDTIETKTYLAMQGAGDETFAWGKRFYMKGGFLDDLTDDFLDVAVEHMARAPGEVSVGLWAQGGAIARLADDATAFNGRSAAFWLGVESTWEDPSKDDEYVSWSREAWDALKPFTTAGTYVNDLVEASEELARAAYGDAKYERLVELKRAYDPDNVFRLNQNIKP